MKANLNSPKLPIEVMTAEEKGSGTAVRTVMGVVGQVPLLHESGHLLRREPVAGTDGSMAGHEAEEIVQEQFAVR